MKPQKILIVDDNPVIQEAFSLKLRSNGYLVLTAMDGAEAVGLVRREKPDLILLDISFPPDVAHGGGVPWDGFLIMQWLRRLDEATGTPIIVISGGDPAKYKDRALAAGATRYFAKPIENEELLTVIRQALAERATNMGEPPRSKPPPLPSLPGTAQK